MNTNTEPILLFAVRIGEVMLKSGAETYRVEDTITRILSHHHFLHVDTFVTPTVVIASIKDEHAPICTVIRRIKNRSTRLDKIEAINQLSRDYVSGILSLEEGTKNLDTIDQMPPYRKSFMFLANGFSSGFFCIMFQGAVLEFIISFLTGLAVAFIQHRLRAKEIINYFVLFTASLFIGVITTITAIVAPELLNTEAIIIGCIMSLVPGVAFTNAIRDTIGDELLSGISRGLEALFIAISIAVGVGLPLILFVSLGGSL